ncbi:6524_t:CDS:1, partial [Acaulospora colombiana]
GYNKSTLIRAIDEVGNDINWSRESNRVWGVDRHQIQRPSYKPSRQGQRHYAKYSLGFSDYSPILTRSLKSQE